MKEIVFALTGSTSHTSQAGEGKLCGSTDLLALVLSCRTLMIDAVNLRRATLCIMG